MQGDFRFRGHLPHRGMRSKTLENTPEGKGTGSHAGTQKHPGGLTHRHSLRHGTQQSAQKVEDAEDFHGSTAASAPDVPGDTPVEVRV